MKDALEKNLTQSGIETKVVEPDIQMIGREREDTDIYFILGGSFLTEISNVLVYIKDICAEDEKMICIAGYNEENEEIKRVITTKLIYGEFERPFDMRSVVAGIKKLCDVDEERKKGKNILLVDDDLTFLKMMKEWLSDKYSVTITRSSMQALKYMATHTPDLILLDYDMPVTNGPQMMEMIRAEQGMTNIPIIFLTGKSDKESVMKVMQLKPQGYLLKSMSRKEILGAVDHYFETKKWKIM